MGDVGVAGGRIEMVVWAIVDLSCPVPESVLFSYTTGVHEVLPVDELDADDSFLWRSDLCRDGG